MSSPKGRAPHPPVWNARHRAAFSNQISLKATDWRSKMPIILWILGVPLSLIIILALFGAF
jgi:hypothetical protein